MADSTHDLDQIDVDTEEIETTVNELMAAGSPAKGFGLQLSAMTGLRVELYAGYALNTSSTPTKITSGLGHDCTDNATNYLSLEPGSPPTLTWVTAAPSGWPGPLTSGGTALYSFVAASGVLTTWTDYRLAPVGGVTKAAILAALDIDSWSWSGDSLTIGRDGKQIILTLETP